MWRGIWGMIVVGPGPEVVVDRVDLGPADAFAVGELGSPGRHLIDPGPVPLPVPPVEAATTHLLESGYVLANESDPETLSGWNQLGPTLWTAHCRPSAR